MLHLLLTTLIAAGGSDGAPTPQPATELASTRRGTEGGTTSPSQQAASGGNRSVPAFQNPELGLPYAGPNGEYLFEIRLPGGPAGLQTGFKEKFLVSGANGTQPRPLLVMFHKFGHTQYDLWIKTQFFQEAWKRGWHAVAPLSASKVNFGSPVSQVNTRAAIEWMTANFKVDPARIYGLGFSMGGGGAMSYAARNLDPTAPMFAAIVCHTGGVALADSYVNEPIAQFIFDYWFGDGTAGSATPWKMAASSMFEFNPTTLVVDPTTDMARNLGHMPVKVFRVQDDPDAYLQVQSDVLASHLTAQGTQTKYEIIPGTFHQWASLSEFKTVNWLSKKKLSLPLSGRTLADRDARFFYFTVSQVATEVFTPFDWDLDLPGNTLTVTNTANLAQLSVATLEAGLDPASTLRVDMTTADGIAAEYVLEDWTTAPSAVTRDAVPTAAYVFDGIGMTLTLQETDGANHVWEITP